MAKILKQLLLGILLLALLLPMPQNNTNAQTSGNATWFLITGGPGADFSGFVIDVDSRNNIYIVGTTESWGTARKAFISKIDPLGRSLFSITFGGSSDDAAYGIAVDSQGSMYVAGSTYSFGAGGMDAYIAKFSRYGVLQWLYTIGGSQADQISSIKLNGNHLYVAGYTRSAGAGQSDILVGKIDTNGTIDWLITIGGPSLDEAYDLCVDNNGYIYVVGKTLSYGFGADDAFVAKITSSGTLSWFLSIGTPDYDRATGITIDDNGFVYVVGWTINTTTNTKDFFVAKIHSSNKTVDWIKVYGGKGDEVPYDVVYNAGCIYVVGYTTSYSATDTDQGEAFIAKISTTTGDLKWLIIYGGTGYDAATAAYPLDGYIHVLGETVSFSNDGSNIYIAKLEDSYLSSIGNATRMKWVDTGLPENVTLLKAFVKEYSLPASSSMSVAPVVVAPNITVSQQTNVSIDPVIPMTYIATPTGEYPAEVVTVTTTSTVTETRTVTKTATAIKTTTKTVTSTTTITTTSTMRVEVTTLVNVTTVLFNKSTVTKTITKYYTTTHTIANATTVTETKPIRTTVTKTEGVDVVTVAGIAIATLIVGLIAGFVFGRGGFTAK